MSNLFSTGGAGNVGASGITQQSLKFNDDESQYLSWTPAAAGNTTTYTVSFWIKGFDLREQTIMSAENGASQTFIKLRSDGQIQFGAWNGSGYDFNLRTTALHRDPSAFYHFVCVMDGGNATSSDRQRIYVNGERRTSFTHEVYTTSGQEINTAVTHYLGRLPAAGSTQYLSALLSDIHFIDGQALDPTSFGQFTDGYWEAKDYAGTYGTNGFHLTFQDDVVSEGFNAATWKGNSPLSQSISGLGFSPDLVWIKSRSQTYNHVLADTVRGQGKDLYSNTTAAESSSSTELISFDADGFSVGSGGSANDPTGSLGFVAWCWDAGSGSAASNTDGSITSTVKANPSYGFSIVSYTSKASGQDTVGHGLNSTPEMIITKSRDGSTFNWSVFHADVCDTTSKYLKLNTTDALSTYSTVWGAALPTSSVFGITSGSGVEASDACIAYCFNSVAGYSSIGSYSGTDSPGVTVTTGFRPAFVMIKATNLVEGWAIIDGTRDTINPRNKVLKPNSSNAEVSGSQFDIEFTDTGFVLNGTDDVINGYSGGTGEYIYAAFADTREAAFWKDVSGQGNHWTPSGLDYRDSVVDSPANNFATWNPTAVYYSGGTNYPPTTMSEGNLKATSNASGFIGTSTMFVNTNTGGKWYCEILANDMSGGDWVGISGVLNLGGYTIYSPNGTVNNSGTTSSQSTYTDGDVIGLSYDMTASTLEFFKNGVSQGSYSISYADGKDVPIQCAVGDVTGNNAIANFGQDSTFAGARPAGGNVDDNGIGDFAYAPPSGYLALCTANLPTPTIVDGSEHFNTVLFTGDDSADRAITVGFQPDLTWQKGRNIAGNHVLIDQVRGATKVLSSDTTAAEDTVDSGNGIVATSTGIEVSETGDWSSINRSGRTIASWNWKAGGTAVSNTAGSITSQVSANTDAGFSIVGYTGTGSAGATVGHGLGVTPDLLIMRRRSPAEAWPVWVGGAGFSNTQYLRLNGTNAVDTATSLFNSTTPTSSVVTLGNGDFVNTSANNYIMYAFASVEGYSKAGSYTGNGSTDGPFVYTGFRPRYLILKRSSTASVTYGWQIYDTARSPYNTALLPGLWADTSAAEAADTYGIDLLSNGFKLRSSGVNQNGSGDTYIYAAFAENPFKYSLAR